MAPASLPSPDLRGHLHRPPVHKVLAPHHPVRHLVVPGLGQALAGRQAHPDLQALGHMEAHEGLFPHLGEYSGCFGEGERSWLQWGQDPSASRLHGQCRPACVVQDAGLGGPGLGFLPERPGEEPSSFLAVACHLQGRGANTRLVNIQDSKGLCGTCTVPHVDLQGGIPSAAQV